MPNPGPFRADGALGQDNSTSIRNLRPPADCLRRPSGSGGPSRPVPETAGHSLDCTVSY